MTLRKYLLLISQLFFDVHFKIFFDFAVIPLNLIDSEQHTCSSERRIKDCKR